MTMRFPFDRLISLTDVFIADVWGNTASSSVPLAIHLCLSRRRSNTILWRNSGPIVLTTRLGQKFVQRIRGKHARLSASPHWLRCFKILENVWLCTRLEPWDDFQRPPWVRLIDAPHEERAIPQGEIKARSVCKCGMEAKMMKRRIASGKQFYPSL